MARAAEQPNSGNSCLHDITVCMQSMCDDLHALSDVSDEVSKVPEVTFCQITVSAVVHKGCSLAKPTAGCVRLQQFLSERQHDAM